ncbi:MAG: phosphate ABC transporter permease subunit PstC [Ilumatobacteraceae bacterium]|jgi:phosphate transport system permease protein|nr:phosphate ABC transporter permease subunit PstC [Acidimicrobiaceae bacterium]MBP6488072.1 phosphate ABC transporter permease subunit PstC [Ilumatobacteraceae bacterium]MBP7889454.1 phosphate ABC transporter permease subunit PstC [Ilumatobacteraceae bacterium]MBP8208873.1 phosphate ABC transporter permease subunit PstC [Ilumatobacteraceae bacterium]HQY14929.1 phosphate ABC transporter permease subunit PstC [Ilumatobacteraceae bacterium]
MSSSSVTSQFTIGDLRGNPRRIRKERGMRLLLLVAAATSIVISALIVYTLFKEAWHFLVLLSDESGLGALIDDGANPGWYPRNGRFDLPTIVIGTVLVSLVSIVVAAPLGLGAAVFLSEYASPRTRKWLKPILEVLAGVPSVVFGFFALRVLGPDLIQPLFNTSQTTSLLVTGVAIGFLVTPLMASISEDALRAVPTSLREVSTGLGARKSNTVIKVVLPAAVSGIVAALIISVSRAVGETMVAALASGRLGQSPRTLDVRDPGLTMTAAMAQVATGSDQVVGSGPVFQSLFFVGALLFLMTLALNMIANRIVGRFRNKY